MPVVLDRLPLPNLTWYSIFSTLLLGCSIYYAVVQVSINPNWKEKYSFYDDVTFNEDFTRNALFSKTIYYNEEGGTCFPYKKYNHCDKQNVWNALYFQYEDSVEKLNIPQSRSYTPDIVFSSFNNFQELSPYIIPDVMRFMIQEPLCIWTLINMAYCVLIVLGTIIQHLIFGELRVSEQQHIKDKFWNFVFYKFIFIFGVMNVQAMDEVILWCSWFSILGFLHLLAQLCKDRMEYLSFSPTTPKRTHMRLLALLSIILFLASSCLMISIGVGFHTSINTFAFMAAECILLMVRTLYVICRYSIYLWDISHEGLWEKRGLYIYYTELIFELSELALDMIHHIHMLLWGNMLLTMASLVIFMQLRLIFYQLGHKVKSHKTYLRVVHLIERYPQVQGDEISNDEDTCAICWETVEIGRRLTCGHLFHSSCLTAWLHHDLSCPTCRNKLNTQIVDEKMPSSLLSTLLPNGMDDTESDTRENQSNSGGFPSPVAPEGIPGSNGWRYVSWLSSFSVEQNHTQLPRHQQNNPPQMVDSSQLDHFARQVQQMFPDTSYNRILEDLQRTNSVEDTIDNILENRLLMPPPMFSQASNSTTKMCPPEKESEVLKENVEDEVSLKERNKETIPPSLTPFFEKKEFENYSPSDSESESDSIGVSSIGSRFSKSPREREQMLAQRKNSLLSLARRKFATKKHSNCESFSSDRKGLSYPENNGMDSNLEQV